MVYSDVRSHLRGRTEWTFAQICVHFLTSIFGLVNGHKHIDISLLQGIHLGKPDNCPDFIYGIMKDCWIREPEKRVQFTTISRRLKDPYHDYDEPPSDSEDGPEQIKTARPGK